MSISQKYFTSNLKLDFERYLIMRQSHCFPFPQLELWQKYISWERSNPLRTEEHALITRRVMFAYEQCLLCMGHHPNIWYEAASFLQESSRLLQEKGVS